MISRQRIFRDDISNPLIGVLCRRVAAVAAAFMLAAPLFSTYQYTQGSYMEALNEEEAGFFDSAEGGAGFSISEVMTEDGFLLKPALNAEASDRTGFRDIFIYTVESGDTLSSIAQRFGLKKQTLMAENDLWNPNRLKTGMQIRILPVDGLTHTVKKGETLDKIAKKYKIEKDLIARQNQLGSSDIPEPGLTLILPGAVKEESVYMVSSGPSSAPLSAYSGPKAAGRLIWPVASGGKLTQNYHRGHTALDIGNRARGPIFAAASGKVIKASYGWNGGYGNMLIIDHGNGMQTLYGHNEKLYASEGQYVDQGQTIAWMGNTGRVRGVTGIHLHFEVRIKGVKYNPMNFF